MPTSAREDPKDASPGKAERAEADEPPGRGEFLGRFRDAGGWARNRRRSRTPPPAVARQFRPHSSRKRSSSAAAAVMGARRVEVNISAGSREPGRISEFQIRDLGPITRPPACRFSRFDAAADSESASLCRTRSRRTHGRDRERATVAMARIEHVSLNARHPFRAVSLRRTPSREPRRRRDSLRLFFLPFDGVRAVIALSSATRTPPDAPSSPFLLALTVHDRLLGRTRARQRGA